jgi:hypothetical protein
VSFSETVDDIERNALTLLDAIHGDGREREIALRLLKSGRVYYPIEYEGALAFAPSKFIGYRDNTLSEHEGLRQKRDGRATNVEISRFLGIPAEDRLLEQRLAEFCTSVGTRLDEYKHSFWRVQLAKRIPSRMKSAVDDIDPQSVGNDSPEYKKRMSGSYTRDQAVRVEVLKRAKGACEYGGCRPFNKINGQTYLETHHVISLSEQGPDRPSNVIALCPNHHREAHFGERWEAMQDEFLAILRRMAF